MFDSVLEVSLK